jgi:hypothetical protein
MDRDINLKKIIENRILECFNIKENNIIISESKLSRIWQYIEKDSSFGVISPFRKNYSLDENIERYKNLKDIVRNKLNLGYIELEGGFKEEGDWIKEKSLLIPNIKKVDLLVLGEQFEQYSVIYKDKNEFIEVGTNDISGKGNIITNFIKQGWEKNIQIDSDLTQQFFSKIAKGSHRDKKFLFNIEECFLFEIDEKTFNDCYRETIGKTQKRLIKLI